MLYINDIVSVFDQCCVSKLYADDLKLYMRMSIAGCTHTFQECINKLTSWSQTWQLGISHKKCSILQVGTVASDWNHDYYIESDPVVQVDVVIDLGIFVDKSLKFDHYINNIVARASSRANLIHKCFISEDITVMTRAFVTYVRPLLEYASCVCLVSLHT